ncbi:TPA: hypothetical protein ACGO3A_000905 [Streptococcus suis]
MKIWASLDQPASHLTPCLPHWTELKGFIGPSIAQIKTPDKFFSKKSVKSSDFTKKSSLLHHKALKLN